MAKHDKHDPSEGHEVLALIDAIPKGDAHRATEAIRSESGLTPADVKAGLKLFLPLAEWVARRLNNAKVNTALAWLKLFLSDEPAAVEMFLPPA